jgi:hypothetical protein
MRCGSTASINLLCRGPASDNGGASLQLPLAQSRRLHLRAMLAPALPLRGFTKLLQVPSKEEGQGGIERLMIVARFFSHVL